jgi:glycosyltransferase involved in cell wall biosynthesis
MIMVNDGSSDGSRDRLREIASRDSRVKVIQLRRNYGQTAAMAAGFDFAKGDVVVPMDADLQNDPEDIPQLLSILAEGYDVVSGWRKERWQDKRISRKLPSLLANILISRVTGTTLHDYGCTLKAYRRTVLNDVKLYGEMHRYIPAFAAWQGARVTEVPVRYHKRRFGKTKYGMSRIFRVMLDLVTVKFLIGYSTKPMHFFGRFGVWSLIVSALAGGMAIHWKIFYNTSLISTPLPLFAALFFIVGVQLILMGLVAEMMTRNYYETSGRPIYNIKDTINM